MLVLCWIYDLQNFLPVYHLHFILLTSHSQSKRFVFFYFYKGHFIIFFLIFIFTLFYFTILYWFWHTLTWIRHGCTWAPKHEPPSHLPPHNIPPGHPRAPDPSMLYPASDVDWWFDSYMIVYIFQCHSPKSSHPLPLPLSPKSVIHICVFFAVLHTGSSLPSF